MSPKPPNRVRAVFGFNARQTGVPERLVPVELDLYPGEYAVCISAFMTAAADVGTTVRVNLQYSLDDYDLPSAERTWSPVFKAGTRLTISGAMQMRGPALKFAPYPEPLRFHNSWAMDDPPLKPKRVLIRPNVELAADVEVRCDLLLEIWKEY